MYAADPQLTARQVLRTFHQDELFLFLGAAFTTLGLLSAAFSFLQRKFDAMLFWLALFAILYGQRLWLQSGLLDLMVPPSTFFDRLRESSNYLVPIPAFFYFAAAGFLGRSGRKIAIALAVPFLCIFVGTNLFGPKQSFEWINRTIVIVSLIVLTIQSLRRKQIDSDFVIVRRGIVVFVAFALYNNISGSLGYFRNAEAVGSWGALPQCRSHRFRLLPWNPRLRSRQTQPATRPSIQRNSKRTRNRAPHPDVDSAASLS
jgi:sigma-B regulation protein RsbU (phosphoserine phosphatase)